MKHEGYAIIDEPLPGRLEKWAMNPAFTLLGLMLGGAKGFRPAIFVSLPSAQRDFDLRFL